MATTVKPRPPKLESPAVRSLLREQVRDALEHPKNKKSRLDEALEETFPASDPISPSQSTIPGGPKPRRI